MIINEEDYLMHFGTLHKSGRYAWGSGEHPEDMRSKTFFDHVADLHRHGLNDTQIAKGLGMTRGELQARKLMYKSSQKQADISQAQRLRDTGMSTSAIGREMHINESSVRSLLLPGQKLKAESLMGTVNMLKDQVAKKGFVDVGVGVEYHLNVSKDKLGKAIEVMKVNGYAVHPVQVDQLGTGGNQKTNIRVLAPPGTTYRDIVSNKDKIHSITDYSDDGGKSWSGLLPPIQVNSDRIKVRYANQGGSKADGVIYVRPGVPDVSLGSTPYGQVRIAVDGTHYMKGMAMYKDGLPKGTDLEFNTSKDDTGNKLDAMKPVSDDEGNPFGAVVHQIKAKDSNGKEHVTSAMNLVGTKPGSGEEGGWGKYSKSLSSQMLSKQSSVFAKSQLAMTYEKKKAELDGISALTNPVVRAKLLKTFADSADSSAVHLKAAALPRSSWHVILPVDSLKDTEVYAPKFRNGERVALIRYPHGGTFEIPELTVNNNHPQSKKLLGRPEDAIGINSKVAERLSGADFDGDSVLVIPNNRHTIKTSPALAELKDFKPKELYKKYDGMTVMDTRTKGVEMGKISNLITDMTIRGASHAELARAVKHSMVVIDAEKHKLNWKLSASDNNIAQLKKDYQGGSRAGASTLISRATARIDVPKYKARSAKEGGPIDKKTGKLVFVPTGESYIKTTTNKRTGKVTEKLIVNKQHSLKLVETENAHTLSSGTPIEKIYADHSNKLKGLANTARLEMVHVKYNKVEPSAKKVYSSEVKSIKAKLDLALRNAPLERQAQVLANTNFAAKKAANADMEPAEIKKIRFQALEAARERTGARKPKIILTSKEWEAIQAGAISKDQLEKVLNNGDIDQIKKLATPKKVMVMTTSKKSRARSMLDSGYTQAEVADALGVSVSTLMKSMG